jgi:hypothetical protein
MTLLVELSRVVDGKLFRLLSQRQPELEQLAEVENSEQPVEYFASTRKPSYLSNSISKQYTCYYSTLIVKASSQDLMAM